MAPLPGCTSSANLLGSLLNKDCLLESLAFSFVLGKSRNGAQEGQKRAATDFQCHRTEAVFLGA